VPTGGPTLRLNGELSAGRASSVSVTGLCEPLISSLALNCEAIRSVLRVRVAHTASEIGGELPDLSGRYELRDGELRFMPDFPFEGGVEYRAIFDPSRLVASKTREPLYLDFLHKSKNEGAASLTTVRVFPTSDVLPENVLRFYIFFSTPMQRGRALDEIALLDSGGRPVVDALYRPPVELWDKTMRCLTVLLDPGRLKRWVGPNVKLGPPLTAGHRYSLEIGPRFLDSRGRALGRRIRKSFVVAEPIRKPISIENWDVAIPAAGTRRDLALRFPHPLDWALLRRALHVASPHGMAIQGIASVDQGERAWRFTPALPWVAGTHRVRVISNLEDVCGNGFLTAFERSIGKSHDVAMTSDQSLTLVLN
jgi:hypothetical protein